MASPSNLIARIYSLYQDRVNSGDFELQVPRPNCSTFDRIPVHKTILATGSPFLKYIVASKSYVQLNSFSFNEIHQITSQEGRINTATVQRMVEFLYTDKVQSYEDPNFGNGNKVRVTELETLKKFANHFQVLSLEQYCNQKLTLMELGGQTEDICLAKEVTSLSDRENLDMSRIWKYSLETVIGGLSSKIMDDVKQKVAEHLMAEMTAETSTIKMKDSPPSFVFENEELVKQLEMEERQDESSAHIRSALIDEDNVVSAKTTNNEVTASHSDAKKDSLEAKAGSSSSFRVDHALEVKQNNGLELNCSTEITNTTDSHIEKDDTELKSSESDDDSFFMVGNEEEDQRNNSISPQNTFINAMSEEQIHILRTYYNSHLDLDATSLTQLMEATKLNCVPILVWFQNQRDSESKGTDNK